MQLSWSIVNISAVARWVCFNKTKLQGCQSWFLFFSPTSAQSAGLAGLAGLGYMSSKPKSRNALTLFSSWGVFALVMRSLFISQIAFCDVQHACLPHVFLKIPLPRRPHGNSRFRGSRLECKRGTRCCWLSSWLVRGSAAISVWLITFPEDRASCEGLSETAKEKKSGLCVAKRDARSAAGFSPWRDFSLCETNKSSDRTQIKN